MIMDSVDDLQDVWRCHLCETPVPELHCRLCEISLSKNCAGEHLLDGVKKHDVVPIRQKWYPTYPKCSSHSNKQCELYCEKCDIPICTNCVSSTEHERHKVDNFVNKIEILENELEELEKFVYPKYKEAVNDISVLKSKVKENTKKMITDLKKHGEVWHKEIDAIIKNLLSEITETESRHLNYLEEEEEKINIQINEISKTILDLKTLIPTKDVCHVSEYESRFKEFKNFPPQLKVSLPHFSPFYIEREELCKLFGSLSKLCIEMKKRTFYTQMCVSPIASPSAGPFLANMSPGKKTLFASKEKTLGHSIDNKSVGEKKK